MIYEIAVRIYIRGCRVTVACVAFKFFILFSLGLQFLVFAINVAFQTPELNSAQRKSKFVTFRGVSRDGKISVSVSVSV